MKTQLANFYFSFFSSKRLENLGIVIAIFGTAYFIVECAITIIQKS